MSWWFTRARAGSRASARFPRSKPILNWRFARTHRGVYLQGCATQRPPLAGNTRGVSGLRLSAFRARAAAHRELTGTACGASEGALGSIATSSELTIIAAGIGLSVVDESIEGIRKSGGVACEPVALST